MKSKIAAFDRHFLTGKEKFTVIGSGSLGGKAQGLANVKDVLESRMDSFRESGIEVTIPTLTVIATNYFELFLKENDLSEDAIADLRDDVLAHRFQKASLSAHLVGDLWALSEQVHTPLAIRSSSFLEDAMYEPFAGVYTTKMIPNNQPDPETRFHALMEAIKFVYASTFFRGARNYMQITHHNTADEKMAVIIQEIVGVRHSDRFYPHISGVARSYNFYPTGNARPEEGVVDLALGLGKSIVDDVIAWSYSPSYPKANPPYNTISDLLKQSQTRFWAVNMGKPPAYDPIKETEYMQRYSLKDAEDDGVLRFIASTYESQNDRISIGIGTKGPRLIDFAPILKANQIPLNNAIKEILQTCEEYLGCKVEIEFGLTLARESHMPARFGFLQVRPIVVSRDIVDLQESEFSEKNVLVASENVLGNGVVKGIRNIVYIKPEIFSAKVTRLIPEDLETINRTIVGKGLQYLLIGFGRWGTSDHFAGIPVDFGQISGAKVIVETTLPDMNTALSQGSHFFHNMTSFRICYFSVSHYGEYKIDWDWLKNQKVIAETRYLVHCEAASELEIRVDGRAGRGVIVHE